MKKAILTAMILLVTSQPAGQAQVCWSAGAVAQETQEAPEGLRLYFIHATPRKTAKDRLKDAVLLPVKGAKYCARKVGDGVKAVGKATKRGGAKVKEGAQDLGRGLVTLEKKVRPAAQVLETGMTFVGAYVLVRKGLIK